MESEVQSGHPSSGHADADYLASVVCCHQHGSSSDIVLLHDLQGQVVSIAATLPSLVLKFVSGLYWPWSSGHQSAGDEQLLCMTSSCNLEPEALGCLNGRATQ